MRKLIYIAVLLLTGFLVPLRSYTTTHGCPTDPTPTSRLDLILGGSIQKIKDSDVEPPPNEGCSANKKYILYFL